MSNLIEKTSEETLADLLGRFRERFQIPVYQRDYSWTDDQVDDLVADVVTMMKEDSEHFFGTIVVAESSPGSVPEEGDLFIIDGQQRLTTAALVLSVARHLFIELAEKGVSSVVDQPGTLVSFTRRTSGSGHSPKITANRVNQRLLTPILDGQCTSMRDVAQLYASLDPTDRGRCRGLFDAYMRIRNQISSHFAMDQKLRVVDDADVLDFLVTPEQFEGFAQWLSILTSTIVDKSLFIRIKVREWDYAFSIFEGLNNRGLDLSERDLIKNTVLARVQATPGIGIESLAQAESRWENLSNRVPKKKFKNFLRHYFLLFGDEIPTKRVVRIFNQHFASHGWTQMLTELEAAAVAYEKLTSPSRVSNKELKVALQNLNALGAERSLPIPLAGLLRDIPPKQLCRVLSALEVLYLRHAKIGGQDNKPLEKKFNEIAAALYAGGVGAVNDVVASLVEETPSDAEFLDYFIARRKPLVDKQARFILWKIENHFTGRGLRSIGRDQPTLEHILPKNPEFWNLTHEQAATYSEDLHRLGNLTLLLQADNSSASNNSFAEKLLFYAKEDLSINQGLVGRDTWDHEAIMDRQREMAQWACETWPLLD